MAWNPIVNSKTADASDMNENFSFVAAGTREPRSSAGVSFVTTDSAYDIGGSSSRWDTAYINNLDIAGSVTTADKSLWVLESETIITVPATYIELTGLNGDEAESYMMILKYVADTTTNQRYTRLWFTPTVTTGTDYGKQRLVADSVTAYALRSVGASHVEMFNVPSVPNLGFCKITMHPKTGNERTGIMSMAGYRQGSTTVLHYETAGFIWNDTSSTITGMKLGSFADQYGPGTVFQLWSRK